MPEDYISLEHNQLVRDSERLRIVTDFVKASEYISKDFLMIILGIEEEKKARDKEWESLS